jgi:U3 small nucleolar RNA-associated protein 4
MIFSSGVDRKTIRYRQLVNGKWVYVDGKCFHQHDVRAMTSYESEQMRMIVSGGISRLIPH